MKKTIVILFVLLFTLPVIAQTFEGKIAYSNVYKSKKWAMSDEKLNTMMGTRQEFYVKGGDYKSITNGTFQWTHYINKENKIYVKILDNETIYWNDANKQDDKILKIEVNKNVIEILGYKCDEVIITTDSGTLKYYFNSIAAVDSKLFVNHKFGDWYDYLNAANAWPLKIVIDNDKFSLVSIATEIKEMKLDSKAFLLPANCITKKNPF